MKLFNLTPNESGNIYKVEDKLVLASYDIKDCFITILNPLDLTVINKVSIGDTYTINDIKYLNGNYIVMCNNLYSLYGEMVILTLNNDLHIVNKFIIPCDMISTYQGSICNNENFIIYMYNRLKENNYNIENINIKQSNVKFDLYSINNNVIKLYKDLVNGSYLIINNHKVLLDPLYKDLVGIDVIKDNIVYYYRDINSNNKLGIINLHNKSYTLKEISIPMDTEELIQFKDCTIYLLISNGSYSIVSSNKVLDF